MTEIKDLLAELKDEREKYTKSDRDKMQRICDLLVQLGHYPAKSGIDFEPLKMVECYGVYWNEWREPLKCCHCDTDLCDHKHGPPFKREIGQYDRDRDETVAYQCPDCKKLIWQSPF